MILKRATDKKIDFTKTADLDLIKAKVADEAEKIVKMKVQLVLAKLL